MCGIFGVIHQGDRPVDMAVISRMAKTLAHRGPDHTSYIADKNACIGHTRLKIIDLSDSANQPFSNEDGSLVITYNGEIYNYQELRRELESLGHRFRSKSDTEVVLHSYEEWRENCLSRFIGMWAFCIWDKKNNVFFLARDRLGVKPLYYYSDNRSFIFASEIKGILQEDSLKRNLSHQALYEYAHLGFTLDHKSWFAGIKQIPPGNFLRLAGGKEELTPYWNISIKPDYTIDERQAAEKIRWLLEDSIRLRLRSDVEIGAHLSGGIDSSTIVAIVSKCFGRPIHAFSGAFQESGSFDERPFIRQMTALYPSINYSEIIVNHENFLETLKKIIWFLDEPIAGPGAYPQFFVSKLINKSSIKVVLGGQGGDELFGGYPHYYTGLIGSGLAFLKQTGSFFYPRWKELIVAALTHGGRNFLSRLLNIQKRGTDSFFTSSFLKHTDYSPIERVIQASSASSESRMEFDLRYYLPSLLHVEDRVSMAFSIETRLPFLDHRLVEYAASIPFYYKLDPHRYKYILRNGVKDILPQGIYQRRDKLGFPTPYGIWAKDPGFTKKAASLFPGNFHEIFRLTQTIPWRMLNAGLWLKCFQVTL